ncbi:MAG: potassium channel protein [Calditrichia bacterium]
MKVKKGIKNSIVFRIYTGLMVLGIIIIISVLGYMFLEKLSFLDALYMTVISITTTGFQEVRQLDHLGRIWTMGVIISGVLVIAFVASQVAELLIQFQGFRRYKMEKQIKQIENHCIVCGYGRMGSKICDELKAHNIPIVVVENDHTTVEKLQEEEILVVEGDATQDEVLLEAGIKRAKYLIAVTSDDASNVFTVLSARNLNKNLLIVARATDEQTISKLEKAGADRVVAAFEIGAARMAYELLHPGLIDFMDVIFRGKQLKLQFQEIVIPPKSKLIGQELKNTSLRRDLNILVILIIRESGDMIYNPSGETVLMLKDRLFCAGEAENLEKFKKMLS